MKNTDSSVVNVLSHSLNPSVKVLSDSDKKKVLSEYSIDETQLPKVLHSDPLVSSLAANVGDVLKIQRNDGTGQYTSYRVVVEG